MRHVAFVEFYRLIRRPDGSEGYAEACGDRSVLVLDGRCNRDQHHVAAVGWAKRYNFDGYRLCRGEFARPFYLTAAVHPVF